MLATNRVWLSLKLPIGAYAAVWGCGFSSMLSMPYLVGSLVSGLGFEEGQAGLVGTLELLTTALVTFVLAPRMVSLPRRNLAIVGAIIAIVGHVLSSFVSDFSLLIACRMLAGIGAGMAMSAGQAAIAGDKDPSRTTAKMMVIFAIAASIQLTAMGYAVEALEQQGAYLFQAGWIVLVLPLLLLLPRHDTAGQSGQGKPVKPVPLFLSAAAVFVVFLFTVSDASVWSFSELKASSLGLSSSDVGWVFGIAMFIGILGGAIATFVSGRFGRISPIVIGLCASSVCALSITGAAVANSYVTSQIFYGIVYTFTVPFLYGLAGEIDHHGRVLVAASSGALLGAAIGPSLSGQLYSYGGFVMIGQTFTFNMVLVLVAAFWVVSNLNGSNIQIFKWQRPDRGE